MHLHIATGMLAALWAGVVFGISFIAQPAKFGVAGLGKALAVLIGRRIFRIMHCVEAALAVAVLALAAGAHAAHVSLLIACAATLAFQAAVLMPRLSKRVDAVVDGQVLPASRDHIIFSLLELVKLAMLILFSAFTACQ